MKVQSSGTQQNQNSNIDSGKSVWVDDSRERRNIEIKRRLQGLQIRRDHLERELQAVKNCLVSLDKQMQRDKEYKQLLIRN